MDEYSTTVPLEKPRRKSAFVEVGLIGEDKYVPPPPPAPTPRIRPIQRVRFLNEVDIIGESAEDWDNEYEDPIESTSHLGSSIEVHPVVQTWLPSRLYRLGLFALLLAISMPIVHNSALFGSGHTLLGASGGVIRHSQGRDQIGSIDGPALNKRDDTQTSICKRWSHQSALVNGTLWIYGGRSITDDSQTSNEWNNDFLTLDLTKAWQIGSPALKGLPRPSGPPKVANGYLWNSRTSLFLYGGEYSDTPPAVPDVYSLWEYNIPSSTWKEHKNPKTSSGKNAESASQSIQRSAEGAGFNVPSIGRGWYFGGHLDSYTTPGWGASVNRTYLKSLLEFTFPGMKNSGVDQLSNGQTAGADGVWRNITEGGLQDQPGFTERADGILVYIPGFGAEGILLGLAGGTADKFTQMNVIDVYDIATSTWYKQGTSGKTPDIRVNPCAVVAAAADGSSYNVYMFGGQNLQPAGEQIQKDDMWILTVPSFTWIQVNQDNQAVPYGRSGHTCHIWDSQMVVVGGYVGQDLNCDSPGIYVYNLSSLEWKNDFQALTGTPNNQASGDAIADGDANPWSQQLSQKNSGLEGSYGYAVPKVVLSVIGGSPTGGATVTAPAQTPTDGPIATGKPITYTVTAPNGGIITGTGVPSNVGAKKGSSAGIISAAVIAGVFGLVACYLAFCTWVYRRQLQLYKNHAAAAQRASLDRNRTEKDPYTAPTAYLHDGSIASSGARGSTSGSGGPSVASPGGAAQGHNLNRSSSDGSSTDDLLDGQEPTFWGTRGVLLNPRRSLRVINKD